MSISLSDMASGAKPVSVFRNPHSRLENTTQAYRRQLKYSTGIVKEKKKTAIVVGTGAGGAMMAKELQGTYQVTILEEGRTDRSSCPLSASRMAIFCLPISTIIFQNRYHDPSLPGA